MRRRGLPEILKLVMFGCLPIFLLGASVLVQKRIDILPKPASEIEEVVYLPKATALRKLALGFDGVVADMLWIRSIDYYADHLETDKEFPQLAHLLELTTTMDPDFYYPYHFGGSVLPMETGEIEEANALLRKGMRHHPDQWQLPFLLGFNYFYYEGDYEKAADHFTKASKIPGSPEYLPRLAARFYERGGRRQKAIFLLKRMIEETPEEHLRKRLEERLEEIRKGELQPPAPTGRKPAGEKASAQ